MWKKELKTDWTVEDICNGFTFDSNEGKGLYGLGGKLDYRRILIRKK